MRSCSLAATLGRVIVAGLALASWHSFAAAPAPVAPRSDCQAARRLPAEADEESRRISCNIPEKYQHDVTIAEAIGQAIRRHDMAAWLTTDALQEANAFESIPGTGRGWLTLEDNDDIRVKYFSENEGVISAFAEATLDFEPFKARDAHRLDPALPADEHEQRLLAARALASSQDQLRCTSAAYNTVIFEFEQGRESQVLVFLMPPWEENNAPFGGYEMYRVSVDGSRIIDRFAQTRGCLNFDPGMLKNSTAFPLTHMQSATPTMFHVFMSLQYRKPLIVLTTQNEILWKVDKGKIDVLRTDDPLYPIAKKWTDDLELPHEPIPTSSPSG